MYSAMHTPWPAEQQFVSTSGEKHREPLSMHQPPEKERLRTVQLLLDNRDRDKGFDAQRGAAAPYNFRTNFETIKGVVAAELRLLNCCKPQEESYAILNIDQFSGDRLFSTDHASHQSFAVVFFEPVQGIKPIKADLISAKRVEFDTPVDLSRLDVSLKLWGGAPMTTSMPQAPVTLVLDLTCRALPNTYGS